MYLLMLTRRYLVHRLMPLLASLSVALSVTMVLVIWSIMGGFLTEFMGSSRTMLGDVVIQGAGGISYYEDVIERLRADEHVEVAAPIITTLGLVALPDGELRTISVMGVEPESYGALTGYPEGLKWNVSEGAASVRRGGRTIDVEAAYRAGVTLWSETDGGGPAVVLGADIGVSPDRATATEWLPGTRVTLSVAPLERGARAQLVSRTFRVANAMQTGRHDIDAAQVLMPMKTLQRMVGYEERSSGVDENAPVQFELVRPAQVTSIQVNAVEGVSPEELLTHVERIWDEFHADHPGPFVRSLADMKEFQLMTTWSERPWQKMFIGEVRKQIVLLIGLFSFVSLTASFLVFSVFWSMISEKTRDIGVLRSLGASRLGITGLFLVYGMALGVVGALLGLLLSYLIVVNINPIHDGLTELLGFVLWDPDVYFFTRIPNRMQPKHAAAVMAGGVLLSLLGALLPAIRAARMDPARALQFE